MPLLAALWLVGDRAFQQARFQDGQQVRLAKVFPMARPQLLHQVVTRLRRLAQRQEAGYFLGDLRGDFPGAGRTVTTTEPLCSSQIGAGLALSRHQSMTFTLLDDPGTVEYIGDDRGPGPRLVRLGSDSPA